MEHTLQRCTITLTVEGPLFVGSGKTIGKKEYILDKWTQKAYIPDMEKMMAFFLRRGLSGAYEKFLLGGDGDFGFWLREQGIGPREYLPWIAYALDSGDVDFDRKQKEIQTFQKDPYGLPYVPGSSLKGALRTVLLASEILRSPKRFQTQKQSVTAAEFRDRFGRKQITNAAGQLETAAFRTLELPKVPTANALNDVLRGLRVGDSEPLSTEALTLCQKIDVTVDGTQNRLNVLRECVMPETELRFPLTIDARYCPYTPDQLMDAAGKFVKAYDACFLKKFPIDEIGGGGNLYLGGGAGYVSKTVLYPLLGERGLRKAGEIMDAQFPDNKYRHHGHKNDIRKGVSPHMLKCTQWKGRLYEMGACTMEIT